MRRAVLPLTASVLLSLSQVLQAALKDDLVVHLTFDTDFSDISGRNNNATPVGNPTIETGFIGGKALFVSNAGDGSESNYATLGTATDVLFGESTDFTVSMWVQLNALNGDPSFFSNKNWVSGGNRGYVVATADDRHLQWNYKEDAYPRRDYDGPGGALPAGQWKHVVLVFERKVGIRTYLDGQLVDDTATRNYPLRPAPDSEPSTIDTDDLDLAVNIGNDGTGNYTDGANQVSHGHTGIDDFALWRRALAAAEVFRIYDNGKHGTNVSSIVEPSSAFVDSSNPPPDAKNVAPGIVVEVVLKDAGTHVVQNSIEFQFDGAQVTPTVSKTDDTTKVSYDPPGLLRTGSIHSYALKFTDDGSPPVSKTNQVTFTVKSYVDIAVDQPFVSENFDGVAEGELPQGWTVQNFTSSINQGADLSDFRSDSYLDWVVVSTNRIPDWVAAGGTYGDMLAVAPDQYVNGQLVTNLLSNNFLFAASTDRSGGQIQYALTRDFDCSGKQNVYLYMHSAWKQNQDSMFAVEYSTDSGASWNPLLYTVDEPIIVSDGTGAVDAVATFNAPHDDLPKYIDPDTSEEKGGTYGAYIAAPIGTDLAPYLGGRVNDDGSESKRVEWIRLVKADNQPKVKFRLANVGTDSWYAGIDEFRLYEGPAASPPTMLINRSGNSVTISWDATASGFILESATTVPSGVWTQVGGVSNNSAIVPIGASDQFFRLRK